jgi:hypothetical protein
VNHARSLAFALIAVALSCSVVSHDEVARVTSPNGALDAILIETNGGATTSFGYLVYVAPKGASAADTSKVASLYGATRSDQAYGVNLIWRSPEDLALEYLSAYSADLLQESISIENHSVRIALVSGISDPAAPPGGMLYNLQGRPDDR